MNGLGTALFMSALERSAVINKTATARKYKQPLKRKGKKERKGVDRVFLFYLYYNLV